MPLSAQAVVTDQEDGLLPPPQLADAEAVAGDGSKKKQPLPPGPDEDNPKPGNAGAAFFPETPGPAAAPGTASAAEDVPPSQAPATTPPPAEPPAASWHGEFWDLAAETSKEKMVSNFESLGKAKESRDSAVIDFNAQAFGDLGWHDDFAVRWTGELQVKEGGAYTFSVTSDDGSKVFVDQKLVVDNDGLHAPVEKTGTAHLEAGLYPVEVLFYEHQGGADMHFRYQGPDTGGKSKLVRSVGEAVPATIRPEEPTETERQASERETKEEGDVNFVVQGHCSMMTDKKCSDDTDCQEVGGGCVFWTCTSDPDTRCASSADCASSGGACTGPGHCSGDATLACSQDDQCTAWGGSCVLGGYCSDDPSLSCMADTDCGDSGGSCRTKNTVWWEADENFPKDPDDGPWEKWTEVQFHKKLLVLMLKVLHLQTDLEAQVPINSQFLGQINWLKHFVSSSSAESTGDATMTHGIGDKLVTNLKTKLSNDDRRLHGDIMAMDSMLDGWDERQNVRLTHAETLGAFGKKMTGMTQSAYDRALKLNADLNFSVLAWNRSDVRPDGQIPELKGIVDRAIEETKGDVTDRFDRYKAFAHGHYQEGYNNVNQQYKSLKYRTQHHVSRAERDLRRINATIVKRALKLPPMFEHIAADGHLETGTIAKGSTDVNSIVQAWLSQVEDLVAKAVSSFKAAKLFKQAREMLARAKEAKQEARLDPKAIRKAVELFKQASSFYARANAAKAAANVDAAVAKAESDAARLEAAARSNGGFMGEFWPIPDDVPKQKLMDFSTLGVPKAFIESDILDLDSKKFGDIGWHDNFAVRWTGNLHVRRAGAYTISVNSDDGSRVYIDNVLVVDNDGLHGPDQTKQGTIDLKPGKFPIRVDFYEHHGGAVMRLKYNGPDTAGLDAFIRAGPPPPAFMGEFWPIPDDMSKTKLMDFSSFGVPKAVIDSKVLDLDNEKFARMGWHDDFAVRWTGDFDVLKTGTYTFFDNSDDGSKVYINGELIINNDGLHGPDETKHATMDLYSGRYPIEVLFYEHHGGAVMRLRYKGPDTGGIETGLTAASGAAPASPPLADIMRKQSKQVRNLAASVGKIADLHKAQSEQVEEQWAQVKKLDAAVSKIAEMHEKQSQQIKGQSDQIKGQSEEVKQLVSAVSKIADFLKEAFPHGAPAAAPDAKTNAQEPPVSWDHEKSEEKGHSPFGWTGEIWPIPEDVSKEKLMDFSKLAEPSDVIDSDVIDFNQATFSDMGWHDDFAGRWTGDLIVREGGAYTFQTVSDDGSKIYVNNTLVANNDGLHAPKEVKGSIDLLPGQYPVEVEFYEHQGGADLHVMYSGPDTSGAMRMLQARVPALWSHEDAAEEKRLTPTGWIGEIWPLSNDVSKLKLMDFSILGKPSDVIESDVIDFHEQAFQDMGWHDDFAVRFTGEITVTHGGIYKFVSRSDDGSKIYVNDQIIVDNDGLHAPRDTEGSIDLVPGRYPVIVEFFEHQGGADLHVKYSGPDTDGKLTLLSTNGVLHIGQDCWGGCNAKQGPCSWCGTGRCCRYGWDDTSNGCDGQLGIEGLGHVCVRSPETKKDDEDDGETASEWQDCKALGGTKGNDGGKNGQALCCPKGCDQCGKDNCENKNKGATLFRGLPWVQKNCCMSEEDLGSCRTDEVPCRCKNQKKCRRKDDQTEKVSVKEKRRHKKASGRGRSGVPFESRENDVHKLASKVALDRLMKRAKAETLRAGKDLVSSKSLHQVAQDTDSAIKLMRAAIAEKQVASKAAARRKAADKNSWSSLMKELT